MPIEIKELIIRVKVDDEDGEGSEGKSSELATTEDLDALQAKIIEQMEQDGITIPPGERRALVQECLDAVKDMLRVEYGR